MGSDSQDLFTPVKNSYIRQHKANRGGSLSGDLLIFFWAGFYVSKPSPPHLSLMGSDSQVLRRNLEILASTVFNYEAKLVRSLSLPADDCKFSCWMHGY